VPSENKQEFEVGSATIAVAGTAQQLTAHRVPQGFYLTVHAHPGNTGNNGGYLYIGKTKAIAEAHHFTLEAGASAKVGTDNVSDVWVDTSDNGLIVEWMHETHNVDVD